MIIETYGANSCNLVIISMVCIVIVLTLLYETELPLTLTAGNGLDVTIND